MSDLQSMSIKGLLYQHFEVACMDGGTRNQRLDEIEEIIESRMGNTLAWRDARKTPPETPDHYLCTWENNQQEVLHFSNVVDGWKDNTCQYRYPKFWMPLPLPPSPVKEE